MVKSGSSLQELKHLDWIEIVKHIQAGTTSGTARQMPVLPFQSQAEAQAHLQKVFDACEILSGGARPFMESLDLFETWHGRLKRKAVLKALEIKDVRSFCLEIVALTEAVKTFSNSWTVYLKSEILDASESLSAIDQIITPRGEIRSDASETLYRLFKEKEGLARQIENTLEKLVRDNDMQTYLQDKFVTTREGRWVLPIRSGRQHSVDGVIHGSSHTKQTVFMEPQIVLPLNNRLRQVEVEIDDEIERLLADLSNYLTGHTQDFEKSRDLLEEADVLFAKAQWSIQSEAKSFEFSTDEIFLFEVKHPLMQISAKKPIPNTVHLDSKKSILLLSGPNAGGKTVLMKSIGLALQMARCGLPICASESSRIPFINDIHVGLGDAQSVDEELSTFAAHVNLLNSGLKLKGYNNLILVDEICGSTDPEEGAALARSFIEQYAKNNCFAIITSHLGPLKSGWKDDQKVMSGSLEYDSKSGRPTYQFLAGIPGDSLAIQTAKRVGVEKQIIDRSMELLSPTTRTRLAGLEEIEQLKTDIHHLQNQLKKETAKAKADQDKYQTLLKNLEKEKENILYKSVRQAEKKIEERISQAMAEQTFKKHAALQKIKKDLPEIVKAKTGGEGAASQISSADEFGKRYPPGTKVYVNSIQQDGIIQSTPNNRGEVLVLSNSMRLSINWQELKPPMSAQNPTATLVRRSSNVMIALQDTEKILDLRGLTVDEALEQLERELDLSTTQKEDRIKIIHGHGTEALKKAIRIYLSRSAYVKKWKAGTSEQGGDGITWAELGGD